LSSDIAPVTKTIQDAFLKLTGERKALFWLLSRFSLTLEQAYVLFNNEYRKKYGILSYLNREIFRKSKHKYFFRSKK